jgi:hypothetical protein
MGRVGDGYGSEYHLHRYLIANRSALAVEAATAVGATRSKLTWLSFPRTATGVEREFQGLEFLDSIEHREARLEWRSFWPTRGRLEFSRFCGHLAPVTAFALQELAPYESG